MVACCVIAVCCIVVTSDKTGVKCYGTILYIFIVVACIIVWLVMCKNEGRGRYIRMQ